MNYIETAETQRANRRFIKQAICTPMLSREREIELATRWRDEQDDVALHELIRAYTRLAISTAGKYRNYGLPMSDLVQEGNVGLMLAARRFDPERGVRFSTYANWWIRSAMQDFILRNWSIVRTGTTSAQKSLFFNFRRLRARIEGASGGTLGASGREQIAEALGVRYNEVAAMEGRLVQSDQSLNDGVGEASEDERQDFIVDERPGPEDIVVQMRDNETRSRWLADALKGLTAREQTIIKERRLGEDVVTLEALGVELGISKERVRQIEHKALQKLRASIEKQIEFPADAIADL